MPKTSWWRFDARLPLVPRKRGPRATIAPADQLWIPEFTNEVQHLLEGVLRWAQVRQLSLDDRCDDCPPSSRRAVDPANRGNFGSRAIDDLSRDRAQSRPRGRLPARLCPAAGESAALGRLAPRTRARPAPGRARAPCQWLVAPNRSRVGSRTRLAAR
jgi:hypothetical protein